VKRRANAPELLDGTLEPVTLAGNLRDMARVNRWLGGADLSRRAIVPLAMTPSPIAILDVGTGGADIPLRLRRKGWHFTATDLHEEVIEIAQRATQDSTVTLRAGPLDDERDQSFDVVHSSMVLHHLEPPQALTFLADARRVARSAVVVNDLNRGWRWLAGAWLLTRVFTRNEYTRHDGPLSVRRAYTADEVVAMARQVGLRPVARYSAFPGYRYAIVFVAD
jgi:2-polyprenyl-3-methyl-5-hydroxy-6-metoxy-1,4-benzoquinol methylase